MSVTSAKSDIKVKKNFLVPQGSVLAAALFLIYMNDTILPNEVRVSEFLFDINTYGNFCIYQDALKSDSYRTFWTKEIPPLIRVETSLRTYLV